MQAMILAAGFGTRLLPFTQFKPKPLFPVLNQPLLKLTIDRLKRAGFSRIIVNCHHLKEQILEELDGIQGVVVQPEGKILGTGGALRKALPLMENEPVLVTNGDIYHTIPYDEIYRNHQKRRAEVTLGMHDYPRFNKVKTDNQQIVSFDPQQTNDGLLAFTGIHILNPSHLEDMAANSCACIVDLYRKLLRAGCQLNSFRTDQYFWTDIGTIDEYLLLHKQLLVDNIPRWEGLTMKNSPTFIGKNVELGNCELQGWCVIGDNVKVGDNVLIKNSVVWSDQQIASGMTIENMLYYQGY